MGDPGHAGAPGKNREMRPGSGGHVKEQHVMGGVNAGTITEGGRTGTGEFLSGVGSRIYAGARRPAAKERVRVESQNRAGADEPTAKNSPQIDRRSGHGQLSSAAGAGDLQEAPRNKEVQMATQAVRGETNAPLWHRNAPCGGPMPRIYGNRVKGVGGKEKLCVCPYLLTRH